MTSVARTRKRTSLHLGSSTFAILLAIAVVGVPVWLVLVTMGKSSAEAQNPDLSPPKVWKLASNLSDAFVQGDVLSGLVNSVIVVVPSVALIIILGSMAAWFFARRPGKTIAAVYGVAISGIVLPPTIITLVLVLRSLGLANTQVGLICTYMAVYLSTGIFLMTGFVRAIPVELEQAAQIDGAGSFRVFWQVVFPLLLPVIATATIMISLFAWNDVFYAFFILGSQDLTLPLNLFQIASAQLYLNNWNLIFSFIFLMSLPLVILFLVAQRRIISGITSGAVK